MHTITLDQWVSIHETHRPLFIKDAAACIPLNQVEVQKLLDAPELVDKFFHEAHRVAERRTHYSPRTIVEYLRHNTTFADSDKTFKINNNIVKSLSVISMELFPALNNLFSTREKNFQLVG